MLRRPSIIRAARRLSTQIPLPTPAICAVQLKPRANANAEVDQWLREGRTILAETLRQHRAKEAVPAARVVGPHGESPGPEWVQESCFHWVHLPSPEGSGHPETVAIVFSREEDLHRWRASRERVEWLATGAPHAADGAQLMVESKAVALQKDDGSLGGWLPDDGKVRNLPPPPTWKVAATVLLAMYPMQELNRTVTPPALSPPRDPAIPPPVAPHLARSPQITGAAAGARRVRRVVRAARRGAGARSAHPLHAHPPPSPHPSTRHPSRGSCSSRARGRAAPSPSSSSSPPAPSSSASASSAATRAAPTAPRSPAAPRSSCSRTPASSAPATSRTRSSRRARGSTGRSARSELDKFLQSATRPRRTSGGSVHSSDFTALRRPAPGASHCTAFASRRQQESVRASQNAWRIPQHVRALAL